MLAGNGPPLGLGNPKKVGMAPWSRSNHIQLFGRDTRLYHFRKLSQCLPNKQVRLPQEFYFFVCLKIYHLILKQYLMLTTHAACVKQTIVVAHHQVRLNLPTPTRIRREVPPKNAANSLCTPKMLAKAGRMAITARNNEPGKVMRDMILSM